LFQGWERRMTKQQFDQFDTDGDGVVSDEELARLKE
jgi:Ca2+-binding EF-hand superfamily protein